MLHLDTILLLLKIEIQRLRWLIGLKLTALYAKTTTSHSDLFILI